LQSRQVIGQFPIEPPVEDVFKSDIDAEYADSISNCMVKRDATVRLCLLQEILMTEELWDAGNIQNPRMIGLQIALNF